MLFYRALVYLLFWGSLKWSLSSYYNTSYILIIIINKIRNRQAFNKFVYKYILYNLFIYKRFYEAFIDLLIKILYLINNINII
jgi:hypothetical protein